MRVISLLPAATEIVAALGAGRWLVGVSHDCDYPPEVRTLPRATFTTVDPSLPSGSIDRAMAETRRRGVPPVQADLEALRLLAPDLVITQSVCDVCAVAEDEVQRVVRALDPQPRAVTLHAHTLGGVFDDIHRAGAALDLAGEAEELVAGLRYRLSRVTQSHAPTSPRPRVLVLEWLDPPYVAGHWVPELIDISGGVDVASRPGERSRALPWRQLSQLEPAVVIVAPCGFDAARAQREFEAITDPDALALFAGVRVEFLDGNAYTSRPGPRLVDAAERLSQLIRG
jgi:iron complex transport system substrate-binding protein